MTVGSRVDLWLARSAQRNQAKVEDDNRDPTAMRRRTLPWMIAMNVGLVIGLLLLQHWLLGILVSVLVLFHVRQFRTLQRRSILVRSDTKPN